MKIYIKIIYAVIVYNVMLLGYVQLLVNNKVNCIYNGYIKGNIKCGNMLIFKLIVIRFLLFSK